MDWHEAIKKWRQQQRLLNQASKDCINITTPGHKLHYGDVLRLQGMSVADIQRNVVLPDKDFWSESAFVRLTEKCAIGDSDAMIELGNYYKKWEHEFCALASNYWYYAAYLYGNKEAAIWYDKWFWENPEKKIPMPILPK